ncbi:basic amino acid ABC transporter substrate-binding protein [Eikenella sp. S3360]|uniref:Basic amino acid ABC transporter substrate-binding protein n=1 Tax=Eikenella glucosivorans TaxID=2766967 RepID=A0ABS0NCR4_9NEIS|nr:basic amino acid ABC transporter substrate-binding protein [Eikenella glucosivorans]MBH5330112.1 basic amino acid ABC transporter substrate-binding protein [Eikenella glucosivorans]
MNMKKWLATALACSAMALSGCGNSGNTQQASQPAAGSDAAASTASAPAEGKVLRVATNAEFAPFEFKNADGSLSGFDIDLLNAIAKEAGYRVEFKDQSWDSLFNSLNNGDVDLVAAAVTITPEREQTMLFTEPYFEITQVVAVPEGKQVASIEDLKNLNRVGVVTGNTGDLAASKFLGATNPKVTRFETLPLLLKELQNGGVDAAVSDSSVVMEFIKHNGDKGFTMIKVPDFEAEHYGIALRKEDTELRDTLNKALAAVRASGEYDRIYQQYFGTATAK